MKKTNAKYPIEVALEKWINKIGSTIVWSIRRWTKYRTTIPKKKDEKVIYLIELLGTFLILIALILRWGKF